ncbi:MAG: HAMP domain-containing histidine kinase [Prevotella sp.]|nr:HAMP domain-containing histidine kinase [Prevotella sp.]
MQAKTPVLQFRSITVNGDSVLWGGFGKQPSSLPRLSRDERNLRFTFAVNQTPLLGHTDYRYRMNGGVWSAWSSSTEARFFNHPSGFFQLEVQARDNMGRLSDIIGINFSISLPFFARWYMLLLYLVLLALAVVGIIRWRLQRLEKEKVRLENIVQERTAEVVKQKDEIEEKSKSLETALKDLGEAQHELIRQEKMATVGKLTQGLIDRILNPLNYINNFSKLSEGLLKDVETNIDDDKDGMDPENYEDTKDVLNMLRTNLQKVGEHGQNTTRTLKAMEEMLKDRSGGIVPMDLAAVLRQDYEMLGKYYEKDIAQYGIKTRLELPEGELHINGNADQLSKTFMSLLGNSIYAVSKKAQRQQYQPEVSIIVSNLNPQTSNLKPQTSNLIAITIRDNGIGIESTIIDKIFDPFFTTKTTGEAAGVGLYLSREIVQNHGGDISVNSIKNEYSEFIITLPATTL